MSRGAGLHRLAGGIAKREREAWERLPSATCDLRRCDGPAAALVMRWNGSFGFVCADHAPQAEQLGYDVSWPDGDRGERP